MQTVFDLEIFEGNVLRARERLLKAADVEAAITIHGMGLPLCFLLNGKKLLRIMTSDALKRTPVVALRRNMKDGPCHHEA